MSVTFIGDVHGWSDRLERLLAKLKPPLVFVGDLIDRGPDVLGVLSRVHALCDSGAAHCLLGNHEYALLRGIGSPALGLQPDAAYYGAWHLRFGGAAVLQACGVSSDDLPGLRHQLRAHLGWLAGLPWVIEGSEGRRHWVAVHAGLDESELKPQVRKLHDAWSNDDGYPPALFDKDRAFVIPIDLPPDWCVVSGHTPLTEVVVTPQRILCDTSGGMPNRPLSAVIWPEGRVVTSES
jgi:hypothetical protein